MNQISADVLQTALDQHGLTLTDEQLERTALYCHQLWKWNEKINLTRHVDPDTFVTRDVIDTLELVRHLHTDERVLDVGSGGGVPGMLLAILRPDLKVALAESVGKKAKVLSTIVRRLKLDVDVYSKRAEDVLKKKNFDTLTIRAVASLRKLLFWFQQHQQAFGRMVLIKGPRWVDERAEAETEGLMERVRCEVLATYPIPGRDHDSVILNITFDKNDGAES